MSNNQKLTELAAAVKAAKTEWMAAEEAAHAGSRRLAQATLSLKNAERALCDYARGDDDAST